jgi:hypothetical protein
MNSAVVPLGLLAAAAGAGYLLVVRRLTDQVLTARTTAAVTVLPLCRVLVAGAVVAIGGGLGGWAVVAMLVGLVAGQSATLAVVLVGKVDDR